MSNPLLEYRRNMVSVDQYLSTSYEPDCEYVDGRIVERNLGEKPHSRIQSELLFLLHDRAKELGMEVLNSQRVKVSPSRYRVPDVTVLLKSDERIVTSAPFICIEILSKDDTMLYMQEKIDDYLKFGVPYVWIINPKSKKAYAFSRAGLTEVSGTLETKDPAISLPLSALFE